MCVMCLKYRIIRLILVIINLDQIYYHIVQTHRSHTHAHTYARTHAALSQSVASMNAVVTVQVVAFSTGRWQPTVSVVTDIVLSPFRRVAGSFDCTLARQLGFHDNLWVFFAYTTFDVGITVMLTRVSKEW